MRQRSQVYACQSPRAVKDGVAQLFDVLVLVFSRVLMLLMQLTKNLLDTFTNLNLCAVTDVGDVVQKRIDKLFIGLK
jgi:hypothetical protein